MQNEVEIGVKQKVEIGVKQNVVVKVKTMSKILLRYVNTNKKSRIMLLSWLQKTFLSLSFYMS